MAAKLALFLHLILPITHSHPTQSDTGRFHWQHKDMLKVSFDTLNMAISDGER